MKKDITEIINTALELDKDQIGLYFEFEQKESGQNPKLFLGFLKNEIKKQRKEFYIDYSRINDEDYAASIINSYSGNDINGFQKRACGLYILEEVIKKQLYLLRKTNENSSDILWIPEQDFILIDFSTFIEDDDSDDLKSLEKISESRLKEDLKINDTITDNKKIGVQGQGKQNPVFENKFNKMPIEEVQRIFTPLIESRNRANQYWMTRKNFDIFLRRSFCKEELNKPIINFSSSEKGCIIKLFYEFYKKSKKHPKITSILKKPYVELLENAFDTTDFFNLHNNNFCDRANCDWMIADK
jgi:hypothetical protein